MVPTHPSSRRHLVEGEAPHRVPMVPLTAIGPDKTGVTSHP
jgi:hypothetical protein